MDEFNGHTPGVDGCPDMDTIEDWAFGDGDCEALDGCRVGPDGHCEHGSPSWLIELGVI